ncbi:hypothetical protein JTB14_011749 [Gonioctena quinquepunctata]|nr:hypothetical protein JTB14_011749 [Gonioctena quinquepunctata]
MHTRKTNPIRLQVIEGNLSKCPIILQVMREHISDNVMTYLFFLLHGLAMSHACYNPIIYCFMNSRFREALFLLLEKISCNKTTQSTDAYGLGEFSSFSLVLSYFQ